MQSTARATPSSTGEVGVLLAGQRAAVARADADGEIDGRLLPLDLARPLVGVRDG
jgi:hypothetical protein